MLASDIDESISKIDLAIGCIFVGCWILSYIPELSTIIKYSGKKNRVKFQFLWLSELWQILILGGTIIYYYDSWELCPNYICDNYFIGIIILVESIISFGEFVLLMILNYNYGDIKHWVLFFLSQASVLAIFIIIYELSIREYTMKSLYKYLDISSGIGIFLILVQYIIGILMIYRIKIMSAINLNIITIFMRMLLNITWSLYLIFHYSAQPLIWTPFLIQGFMLLILFIICLYYIKYTRNYDAYKYKLLYEQFV